VGRGEKRADDRLFHAAIVPVTTVGGSLPE
jgi:hypothetical protein